MNDLARSRHLLGSAVCCFHHWADLLLGSRLRISPEGGPAALMASVRARCLLAAGFKVAAATLLQ